MKVLSPNIRILLILCIIGALFSIGYWMRISNDVRPISLRNWSGKWELTYFFEKEPQLLFEGELEIDLEKTITGTMKVYPPKRKRAEIVRLEGLSFDENTLSIEGYIIHEEYKLQGGYSKEVFKLELISPNTFTGKGACIEFCAEGTETQTIVWEGLKIK